MGCPGAEWVERQIPHIANDGTITVYEGWTLHHDYRFGIGLHATLDVPCLTIKAGNAFVQRFLAAEAEYANPNPISYRYHEIENWHVESNAIAVPDQYSKPVSCKDNQTFLHARFCLGDDVLKPYKTTIDRWLWPDMFKNQDTSVSKAKKAISDYKKAIGQPEGLAELMVIYCERAAGFSDDVGLQDEGYFDALVRIFEQALKVIQSLPEDARPALHGRLDAVRRTSHNFGYAVGDDMDDLLAEYGIFRGQ